MWHIFIYFTIHLLNTVQGKEYSKMLTQSQADLEFDHIAKCINTISEIELKFKPTVKIDTQNIKEETKRDAFTKTMINQLMPNKIPAIIIDNNSSLSKFEDIMKFKESYLNPIVVVGFDTCNITSFNFTDIKKDMKHLFIILNPTNNCFDELQEIKHSVNKKDVTFILLRVSGNRHKMFTFIPVIDKAICKEVTGRPIHINTCFRGILQNKEVFPSKNPNNLNKCPLRVGMATLFPFSDIKGKETLKNYDHISNLTGSDNKVIQIIANYFNATQLFYYIQRKEENPYGDYAFLKLVLNGSLDVCAGGLYRVYGDIVEYSGIYARQAILWIYTVERAERSWENLIGKLNGLYIFIIFYVVYTFVWYLLCLFDEDTVSLRNTFLYGWGALVGATSLQAARSLKQKILNLTYLTMIIHFSAYINIQFFSFLTVRGPPHMFNTIDEVMESGRVPYLKSSSKYFVNDKKYIEFANTSADCVSFLDCAEKTLKNNGLTVVLQGNFYYFQSSTAVAGEARVLRATENILTVYNEMLVRKDSSVAKSFGKVMQRLFEAGITERLYSEAIGILVMAKAASANSNMITNSYSCQSGCTVTLNQFGGIFYAWIIGCVLSCLIFTLELCLHRNRMPVYVN